MGEKASNLGLLTACLIFDQPLWVKAVDIVNSKNLEVVVRLGGFHQVMNFLESIEMFHFMNTLGLFNRFNFHRAQNRGMNFRLTLQTRKEI